MINIITTVFDALLMFILGGVFCTCFNEKKTSGVCIFMIVILMMNLFCIWGVR